MDIKAVSQLPRATAAPDAGRVPADRSSQSETRVQVDGAGKPVVGTAAAVAARDVAAAISALKGTEAPRITTTRSELNIDEATRRVFAQVFDSQTGRLLRQVPSEESLRLAATTREQISRLFKTDV